MATVTTKLKQLATMIRWGEPRTHGLTSVKSKLLNCIGIKHTDTAWASIRGFSSSWKISDFMGPDVQNAVKCGHRRVPFALNILPLPNGPN